MDTHRYVAPYHAELNSIELFWAMLKGKVARSNLTFKKDTDTVGDCNGGSTDDERTDTVSHQDSMSVWFIYPYIPLLYSKTGV